MIKTKKIEADSPVLRRPSRLEGHAIIILIINDFADQPVIGVQY